MELLIQIEQKGEVWLGVIPQLPFAITHGDTREQARQRIWNLAIEMLADKVKRGLLTREQVKALQLREAKPHEYINPTPKLATQEEPIKKTG